MPATSSRRLTWPVFLTLATAAALLAGWGGRSAALAKAASQHEAASPADDSSTAGTHPESPATSSSSSLLASQAKSKGLAAILALPDPLERMRLILAWSEAASAAELAAAYPEASKAPSAEERSPELQLVLRSWAAKDPIDARDWAARDGNPGDLAIVARRWAKSDPAAALGWIQAPSSRHLDDRYGVMDEIMLGMLEGDPFASQSLWATLPANYQRRALSHVMPELFGQGIEFAKRWLTTLPGDDLRRNAFAASISEFARVDPLEAAKVVRENLPDGPDRVTAYREIAKNGWWKDLPAAKAWVDTLPRESRSGAVEMVARQLIYSDVPAAGAWLQTMNEDPGIAESRSAYLIQLNKDNNREAAVKFISTLAESEEKERLWVSLCRDWVEEDEAGARAWMALYPGLVPKSIFERVAALAGHGN